MSSWLGLVRKQANPLCNNDRYYVDSDGDIVTISSDEELVEALDQFEGNIFRLYLKKSNCFCLGEESISPIFSFHL